MRRVSLLLGFICLSNILFAQSSAGPTTLLLKGDSVKVTNCDSAELIIENHTQNIPGYLFNTGNGRTIFKRALIKLSDSTFLLGGDTLNMNIYSYWKSNYPHIYNTNPGNVGIRKTSPKVLFDLPGPINIDDTSAYRIGYHPMMRVSAYSAGLGYTNLFIGDSTGYYLDGSSYNTYVGNLAGVRATGSQNVYVGQNAGYYNVGGWNTFLGTNSGTNNGKTGVKSENNTFLGFTSGYSNAGSANTFLGLNTGRLNAGDSNMFVGFFAGSSNTGYNNTFSGVESGYANTGYYNSFVGMSSGSANRGNQNVFVGFRSGTSNVGSDNVFVGHYSGLADSIYPINKITLIGDSADVAFYPSLTNSTAIGHRAIVKNSNTMVFGDVNVNSWLFNTNAAAAAGTALVVGSNSSNGNGAYLTTGGVWTNASDRAKKEHFTALDNAAILEKIGQLPITRWNYKGLTEQHIGPVAQDFYHIFQVGADDKTISTIDPSGIALAGIQELYRKWQQAEERSKNQQSRINEKDNQIKELISRLEKQEASMSLQQEQLQQLKEEFNKLSMAMNNIATDYRKDIADCDKCK